MGENDSVRVIPDIEKATHEGKVVDPKYLTVTVTGSPSGSKVEGSIYWLGTPAVTCWGTNDVVNLGGLFGAIIVTSKEQQTVEVPSVIEIGMLYICGVTVLLGVNVKVLAEKETQLGIV